MRSLNDYQWFNQSHPQTLQIGVIILYLHVVFGILGLGGFGGIGILVILGVTVVLPFLGAVGSANDKKWGYFFALAAALSPFILRLAFGGGLLGTGLIQTAFEVALVALFVHPMTRSYVKLWFR